MKYCWHGHSCVSIEFEDQTKLIIDPFLTGNPLADISWQEVECDYILLTHGHNDHVGDTLDIAKKTGATVICNPELAHYFSHRGLTCHAMNIGGAYDFGFARIFMCHALHSSTYTDEDNRLWPMGLAAGYVIHSQGINLYHAGDTGVFSDMRLLNEDGRIHVAFLPVGGNYTMDCREAVKAYYYIQCKKFIPIHYNTFPEIHCDPSILNDSLPEGVLEILKPGQVMSVKG